MTDSDVEFHTAHDFLDIFAGSELQTTHDFLDVFDDDELWGGLPVDTPPAAAPSNAVIPFPASRRVRRVTPKEQIDRLRDETRQLSAQLQALEAESLANVTPTHRSELWHQLAIRQLERRRNSESENRKLRDMVRLQIEEAKSLSRFLRRRTRIQVAPSRDVRGKSHKHKKETSPLAVAVQEGEQVFEGLLLDVENLYKKISTLFTEKGIHSIPCPGRKRHTDNTVLNGVCFELTKREIVPFGVEKVKDAVWSSLGQLELEGLPSVRGFKTNVQFRTQNSDQHTKTAMTSFISTLSSGRTASVKGQKVVRRYDEESRTVFVYRVSMDPNPHKMREPFGVHATSTLVIEIRHADLDDEATLIQSHFSVTRHDEGLAAGHPLRVAVNLNTAITVWDETISRIHDGVENRLMDRARQSLGNE
ncbi:hypothetical protein GQ600_19985 [Phytophthora cactorum]|nr:hypothetical protein GQ600_19985 [Phytophthora cactorum]